MITTSVSDFRRAAQRRLPRFLFDYLDGAAGDEATLNANVRDLQRLHVRQRVLTDVSNIDLSANWFGRRVELPVALAPVGMAGMYGRRGEAAAARAAASHGVPFCLSTVSICGIEEVVQQSTAPIWFQLYVIRDRSFMRDLIARAEAARAAALVFTVDMPVPGNRRRDAHSGLSGPNAPARRLLQAMTKPGWAWSVGLRGRPHSLGNLAAVLGKSSGLKDYMGWLAANFDPSIRWSDLDWIRDLWKGPLIIKGILDPEDAREAQRLGADGIVVSNHGGRQLDGAISTIRALPSVMDAVGGAMTVFADSGVRSGLDVVRMLAAGADGVLLGRAWIYALAAKGEVGVAAMLDMIAAELRTTMALTGCTTIGAVNESLLDIRR